MLLRKKDLYTHREVKSIGYGTSVLTYEVQQYKDVRNLTEVTGYLVTCTQRLIIPNSNAYVVTPQVETQYNNYPALLTNEIDLDFGQTGETADPCLLSYSPKTLNTAIITDTNDSTSSSSSRSENHTAGSSIAQSNSYSASISVGDSMMGGPSESVSITAGRSNTHSTDQSLNTGQTSDSGNNFSDSNSMSIKDWGSYAILDSSSQQKITWVWGQEYPWNVAKFKSSTDGQQPSL